MCVSLCMCESERGRDEGTLVGKFPLSTVEFRLGSLPEVNVESWYLRDVFLSVMLQMNDPYISSLVLTLT